MRLLLDTVAFLWIVEGADQLSAEMRGKFSDAGSETYLSSVSAWEITVKHALGKLPLPEPPERFIPRYRTLHRIETLPFHEEAALHLMRLPAYHKDPFDRMLICQAIAHGLSIVTPDPLIRRYSVRTLW